MNIPIELFSLFIGASIALGLFGFLRNPQVPALMTFGGIFILFIAVMTTTIQLNAFSNGSTDAINQYDITSSTGQITVNSAGNVAIGERLSNTSSELNGKTIDCITVYIGRAGTPPVGTLITVGVMNTNTQFISQFGSMNVTSLISSAVSPYQFCLPIGQSYTFSDTETIGFKWNDGDGSNTLTTRVDGNDPFDGSNTERVVSTTGNSWAGAPTQDLMMQMTLRGSTGQIIYDSFEFTEMPKVIFSLLGVIFMLSGALMVFKGQS